MKKIKRLIKLLVIPFKYGILIIYKSYFTWLLERRVRKANRLAKEENRRYIVTMMHGRPAIYTKQTLKEAIKRRKFKKGVTIQDIEKQAYYITK